MEETLSPNPNLVQKQRLRIQSPTTPFFLGSNDDQLERAQARAARAAAAAVRRKNVAANVHSKSGDADSVPCLDKQHILELLHNCIKLASENVIISICLVSWVEHLAGVKILANFFVFIVISCLKVYLQGEILQNG